MLIQEESAKFRADKIYRLTALWALSEAFLGGILHAFRIPFTGLVVGNVAVIIIILIASFSSSHGIIMRACLITIIIKALVSPHTPFTAHLAVLIQSLLGEIIFWNRGYKYISSVLLGIITAIFSSLQKVIFLTIVFGNNLWNSIDQFFIFVIKEVFGQKDYTGNISISYWIIFLYIGIHLIVGFLTGIYGARLEFRIKNKITKPGFDDEDLHKIISNVNNDSGKNEKSKRKGFRLKLSKILFTFSIILLILSYIYKGEGYFNPDSVLFMIGRSVLIMIIWIKFITPSISKLFRKKLIKDNKYTRDVESIIKILPSLRAIVKYSWMKTKELSGLRRLSDFIVLTISILLTYEIGEN